MPRKRKGELPSGNIRRQVFIGWKPKTDKNGNPVIDSNGNQIMVRKYESVTASTVAEVDLLAAQIKADTNKENKTDMTLRNAMDSYIDIMRTTLSPTTINSYEIIRDHAFASIKDKKLNKLNNDLLQNAINLECNRISTSKRSSGKPISAKTVCNEWGFVSTVINKYMPSFQIQINLPKHKSEVHDISSPEEIFRVVKGTDIELPVLLSMWLSFTMSEIRGLTKSGSIKGDYIYVDKVIVYTNNGDIEKSIAKNDARNRMHRLPAYIKELIDKVPTDRIVSMSSKKISDHFRSILKKNGLPHMSFHDLRHVNASVMSLLNVPDKYAMERGGWTTDRVMKGTYMQVYNAERIKIDNSIDEYFENALFKKDKDGKKYLAYLTLFDKNDCEESKKEYADFVKCNTKCNTHKKKP